MLLYSYPKKLDRREQLLKAANDLAEHKKMQRNMYKNILLAAVIILIGFFAPVIIVKVILWIIGAGNLVTALLLYQVYALSRSTDHYTNIYDDHIEHRQVSMVRKIQTTVSVDYSDIEKSFQDKGGRLILCLKDGAAPNVEFSKPYKAYQRELESGRLPLTFQDTRTKLYLIDELSDKIKYPKKEYNVIEDDDEDEHENIFHL